MLRKLDVVAWTILIVGAVALIASCTALDKFVTPDPDTGVAPIEEVGETIVAIGESAGLTPWAQIAAGALSLLGGGYLLWRRIQKARAGL